VSPASPPGDVPPPRKALGQHFLHDRTAIARIVEGAGVTSGDRVLEIGPGTGALTRALLDAGARVWAVEADPRMVAYLEAQGWEGLHVIQGDALRTDFPALAREAGGRFRLVANLPYNISGPLLALLLEQRAAFSSMTVMLQREVAERLLAPPGGRSRGVLSVLAQAFCRVRPVLRVRPGAFWPPPRVESQVVRLDVRAGPVEPLADEAAFRSVVRVAFGRRRKMLRNALGPLLGRDADACFRAAGLSGRERPEELPVETWIRLANAVTAVGRGRLVRDRPTR